VAFLVAGRRDDPGEPASGPTLTDGGRAWRRILALAVALAVLMLALLTARYLTWHSFVFDLGGYDQKVWLIAIQRDLGAMLEQTYRAGVQTSPCGTVRYWGICHFQPLYLLYGFAYHVWASPLLLLWSQVLLVASGVIPCFLLARDRVGSPAAGVLGAFLYALHPAVQFNGLLDFRPDHIAIPFLLWAFWLADQRRYLAAAAMAAVPALAKESLLLAFAGFGLYLIVRKRRIAVGTIVFALGMATFAFVAFVLLAAPGRSEGAFMLSRYFSGGAGFFASELLIRKAVYLVALFGPLALLPLLDPLTLLPAGPALAIAFLSSDSTHVSIQSQYSAAVVAPMFAALFAVLSRLARHLGSTAAPARILSGLVVLAWFFAVAQGPMPLSLNFWIKSWGRQWHYSQYVPDRQGAVAAAAALIPAEPDLMVVTQNDLNSARLAHRHLYFPFPAGLEGADYVFLDQRRLPFLYWVAKEPARYAGIVADLRQSPDYRMAFERDGVFLFARVGTRRPGTPDLRLAPPPPTAMPQ